MPVTILKNKKIICPQLSPSQALLQKKKKEYKQSLKCLS
jgi:hypothetical protein